MDCVWVLCQVAKVVLYCQQSCWLSYLLSYLFDFVSFGFLLSVGFDSLRYTFIHLLLTTILTIWYSIVKSSIWPSGFWDLTEWFQNTRIWPSGSKILVFDRVVPVCNRQENFKCFRSNDIPGEYLGSLSSLDSGAKGGWRKVRIGVRVRVRARYSFQKQTTPEPLGQILIFWNHSVKY